MPRISFEDFNLLAAERRLFVAALEQAVNVVGAARLSEITRHALKRRMIKLGISRSGPSEPDPGPCHAKEPISRSRSGC